MLGAIGQQAKLIASEVGRALLRAASASAARSTLGSTAVGSSVFTAASELAAREAILVPRKNAVINGDFNVWQRGTSFGSAASGAYHADRWFYQKVGAMVHDISRSADIPTVAQAGRLFNYSMLVDCQTVDAAIAAGDYAFLGTKIEGYNFLPLAQRAITLSFWVMATKTGTYCIFAQNSGSDRSYVGEYTVNATATWEKKTVTLAASPSAGTWNYTSGVGLMVGFTLAVGSTFQTTASAWQTGNFFGTANQVNACDNVANDFRITGVQLEAGSVATEFEYRTFQQELALCQRYCEVLEQANEANVSRIVFGQCYSATLAVFIYQMMVRKRAAPSVAVSAAGDFLVSGSTGAGIAVTALTPAQIRTETLEFSATVAAGLTAGNASQLLTNSVNAKITINAEL